MTVTVISICFTIDANASSCKAAIYLKLTEPNSANGVKRAKLVAQLHTTTGATSGFDVLMSTLQFVSC